MALGASVAHLIAAYLKDPANEKGERVAHHRLGFLANERRRGYKNKELDNKS